MRDIDRLLTLLGYQQDVLTRLLELVQDERKSLLDGKLDGLEAAVDEQADLLAHQQTLSRKIVAELEELGKAHALNAPVTLSSLVSCLKGQAASSVRELQRSLTAKAEELQREGRVNWYLARQAMQYVDFTLKLIANSRQSPQPYAPHAQVQQRKALRLLMDSCV